MFLKSTFGERIKALRMDASLTQQQLGWIFNCSSQTVNDVENGKHVLSIEQAYTLSIFFDVSLDYLLGCDSIPKRKKGALKQRKVSNVH